MAKLKQGGGEFVTCPDYSGPAVCVDVTPLKERVTQFGSKMEFRFAFEVAERQPNGEPYCVWSRGMTLIYNDEKANLRKFLTGWMGRTMSKAEADEFDTESMLGVSAQIVVVQETKEDKTYANIVSIRPAKEQLQPSGKFVRKQDRDAANGGGQSAPRTAAPGAPSGQNSAYRKVAEAPAEASVPHGEVKVHVGKCVGLAVRDLAPEQLDALAEKWLPAVKAAAKTTADDRRLIGALEAYLDNKAKAAAVPADDVPY